MTEPLDDARGDVEMAAAALVALTEQGIPADVQELLVYGNPDRGIAPGALSKAVRAVLVAARTNKGMVITTIPSPDDARGALTRLAAECHRAKWQFDLNEDYQPSKSAARGLITRAFSELHRIGDIAMKMRDEARALSPDPGTVAVASAHGETGK